MRSVEEIVNESLERHGVSLVEFRGARQSKRLRVARRDVLATVWAERPDLSSGQVAIHFNRDPSGLRHMLRKVGATA